MAFSPTVIPQKAITREQANNGHINADACESCSMQLFEEIAAQEGFSVRHVLRLAALGFISPLLMNEIADCTVRENLTISFLTEAPPTAGRNKKLSSEEKLRSQRQMLACVISKSGYHEREIDVRFGQCTRQFPFWLCQVKPHRSIGAIERCIGLRRRFPFRNRYPLESDEQRKLLQDRNWSLPWVLRLNPSLKSGKRGDGRGGS